MLGSADGPENGVGPTNSLNTNICLRCGRSNHLESDCRSKDQFCVKCKKINAEYALGHRDSIHEVKDSAVRLKVVKLLGPRPFFEWAEAKMAACDGVQIITKRSAIVSDSDKFESPDAFGGTNSLLSAVDFGEVGGLKSFNLTNSKILEIVSHNNLLLMERLRETVEDCNRQLKEKDDQIRFGFYDESYDY